RASFADGCRHGLAACIPGFGLLRQHRSETSYQSSAHVRQCAQVRRSRTAGRAHSQRRPSCCHQLVPTAMSQYTHWIADTTSNGNMADRHGADGMAASMPARESPTKAARFADAPHTFDAMLNKCGFGLNRPGWGSIQAAIQVTNVRRSCRLRYNSTAA